MVYAEKAFAAHEHFEVAPPCSPPQQASAS